MAQVNTIRAQDVGIRDGGRVSLARLTWATVVAALIAAGASVALFSVATAAGFVDQGVVLPSVLGFGPLSIASVSATAVLASLAAGVGLGVLAWSTRQPFRNFRVLATALALLSLTLPATIPGPTFDMRVTMAGMHVIVWAVSLGVLATLAARPLRRAL